MHAFLVLLLVLGTVQPAHALETARELALGGTPRLALARVESLQPGGPQHPRWAEWEALHLELLFTLGRDRELLARAHALPAGMPAGELRRTLVLAARAGVAAGEGRAARTFAARLLWELAATGPEARALRLLVIESHIAERNGEAAFLAMLRYTQDYRPIEHATAARFVEALLDLGRASEAVNWLSSLEEGSVPRQRLLLRSGVLALEGAGSQVRARLPERADRGHWQVIAEAAARLADAFLELEAREQLLQLAGRGSQPEETVARLWQGYLDGAAAAANRHQLLVGDDAAWADFATRRVASEPVVARAFFAYLAQRARVEGMQRAAQLELVLSLERSGLDLAAIHLFQHAPAGIGPVGERARVRLGTMAETRAEPALAARFWDGLSAPPGSAAGDWHIRLALVHWRAGNGEAALGALRRGLNAGGPYAGETARRGAVLGREVLAAGDPDLAQAVLDAVLPDAGTADRRIILFTLGRIAEATARFAGAADYYLRSALPGPPDAPDAFAQGARLAAALNLVRAGYKEDARAQFEWLMQHSGDAVLRDIARSELERL
jgi:hypothetical protein